MNTKRVLFFSMLAFVGLAGLSGVGALGVDNAYACHKGEPHGAQDPCGTTIIDGDGDTEITVRDFLNENNNNDNCNGLSDICIHQGEGDNEINIEHRRH